MGEALSGWRLAVEGGEALLLRAWHAPAPPGSRRLRASELLQRLPRLLAETEARSTLLGVLSTLAGPTLPGLERRLAGASALQGGARAERRDQHDALRSALALAIESGRLVGYELRGPDEGGGPDGSKPHAPPPIEPPPTTKPPVPKTPPKEDELTWYDVRVVDELGEPVAGLPLVLEAAGKHPLVTDGDGRVRLDGVYPSFGQARLEDLTALREILRPRWDLVRAGDWLAPEPDHTFVALRGSEPILRSVLSETPHTLVIQPWVIRARLIGMYFDTSKCFLLPTALGDIQKLKQLYDDNPSSAVLVVGHTDKTGDASYNDRLSLERADAVAAFLRDDVEAWLPWYGPGTSWEKRWGAKEDHLMLASLPDYGTRPLEEGEIRWFQRTRSLKLDGWAGDETRRQLITEYMAHDGTTLPASATLTTHGCGESFPFTEEELVELDLVSADPNQRDRRVELYFFDRALGVEPPPPGAISGPGSAEYPEWGRRARETHDFDLVRQEQLALRLHDQDCRPWPHACARAIVLGEEQHLHANASGWIAVDLPEACAGLITVEWGGPSPADEHPFGRELFVECLEGSDAYRATARLHNLGYPHTLGLELAAKRFQADYAVDAEPEPLGLVNGELPPATAERLEQIYVALDCNATPE